ncbi:hypothetical protein D7W81_41175, partial [Corallococcus aberystwythensis]
QSLQRAFRGIADRLLPFMGGDVMRQWVICALDALYARDVQALQHQLPALMKTYDELVLDQLAPVPREQAAPEAPHAQECSHGAPASGSAQDEVLETNSCVETRGPGHLVSGTEDTEALGVAACPPEQERPVEADNRATHFPATLDSSESRGALSPDGHPALPSALPLPPAPFQAEPDS